MQTVVRVTQVHRLVSAYEGVNGFRGVVGSWRITVIQVEKAY